MKTTDQRFRITLAIILPFLACGLQTALWEYIQPFVFFFFYPALFVSIWLGGVIGGLIATLTSTLLLDYFFLEPRYSFDVVSNHQALSILMFVAMGVSFTLFQGQFKKAIAGTQRSESRFYTLFEQAPLGVALIESNSGHIYEANPRFVEITGRTREQLASIDWMTITHPDDIKADQDKMAQLNAGEITGFRMDKRYLKPDGSVIWIRMTIAPVESEPTQSPRHLCMIEDITESKASWETKMRIKIDEACHTSESRLELLVAQSLAGVAETDLKGHFIRVNHLFCQLVGRSVEELLGLNIRDITHPNDWEANARELAELIRTGQHFLVEKRYLRPDGKSVWVRNTVGQLTNTNGEPIGLIAMVVDISEAKRKTQEMEVMHRLMQNAEQLAELGAWEYDVATRQVLWSGGECRIFGIEPGESPDLATLLRQRIHPDDAETLDRNFRAAVRSATPFTMEYKIVRLDGVVRIIRDLAQPEWDRDGKVVRYLGATLDMTAIRQVESALKESEERLRLATEAARVGIWEWNIVDNTLQLTPLCLQQFGLASGAELRYESILARLHPDDRVSTNQAIHKALNERADYLTQYRSLQPDGSYRWIRARGRGVYATSGKITGMIGITLDVTESQQARMELEHTAQRLQSLVEASSQIVWHCNAVGEVIPDQVSWLKFTGQSPKHFHGLNWLDAVHPEDRESLLRVWNEAMASKQHYETEYRIRRHDGEYRLFATRGVPLLDAGGQLVEWMGASSDITERRLSEQNLIESERRFRSLFEHLPIAYQSLDIEGRWLDANQKLADLFGYSHPEEVLGKSFVDHWDESIRDQFDGNYEEFKYRHEVEGILPMRRVDGSLISVQVAGRVQRDAEGRFLRTHCILFDVTERQRAEAKILASEERLRLSLEAVNDGVWDWDVVTGRVIRSQKYYEMVHCRPEDDTHDFDFFRRLVHPDDVPRILKIIEAHKRGETPGFDFTCRLANTADGPRWLRGRGKVILRDEQGKPLRILGTITDVTMDKNREQELEHRVDERTGQLKSALEAKGQFMANMSHEIRNPLNTINILASLLATDSLNREQSQYVSKIQANVQSLASLIDDILDFSKMESGQFILDIAPFRIGELINHLKSRHEETAQSKGLAMHWLESPWEGDLFGDLKRIEQVLDNLIGNAVKFTERGDVWSKLSLESQSPKDVTLKFEVMDSGIGIQPEIIPILLEPFTQADSSITRRFGGTGLGLAISKHLVGLMGSEINISSTFGMGSVFTFTLTLPKAKEEQASNATDAQLAKNRLKGSRILAVDDDEVSLSLIKIVLEGEGAIVNTATNGKLALDWLRNHPGQCHVVLMDIQMPVMDGITATRLIRNVLGLKDLPILAVTAGILPDQHQAALDAGITEMVRKPVDIKNLIERLICIWK